jgi:hypothetical protein
MSNEATKTNLQPYPVSGPARCSAWAWAGLWHCECKLDGITEHLLYGEDGLPKLCKTRKQMRAWIEKRYGYIKRRPDLRTEPFCWRLPTAIKVTITPNESSQATLTGRDAGKH